MEESKAQRVHKVLIRVFIVLLLITCVRQGYFSTMSTLCEFGATAVGFVAAVALIPVLGIKDGIKNDETQRILIGVTFAILFGLAGFRGCYDRFFNMIYAMLP